MTRVATDAMRFHSARRHQSDALQRLPEGARRSAAVKEAGGICQYPQMYPELQNYTDHAAGMPPLFFTSTAALRARSYTREATQM